MAEIAKIVQGNNFNVAIPLKVYILNEGEVVLEDYTPAEGDDVTIRLVGERRGYTYKPTTEGNVAHLQLSGHEVCDTYAVEVVIISPDGTMLRSYRGDQLAIVYNVDTIIADGAVEDGELYLDSQFFIQGEKGEQGDPGQDGQDGTDGQDGADGRGIVSITKTATQGLVDTYTITYTDDTTSTFEVTNGKDGSGEDSLIVTLTYQSGTYKADKTYNEITAAIQAGRNVLVFSSVSQNYATLSRATSGKVEFSHIESVGSQMMGQFLVCNSNDTWAASSKTIQQGLVSGTNIKTINSQSVLGSGNIAVATPTDLATYCPIIEDTRQSAVAAITGSTAPFSSLVDGQRITLHLNQKILNNPTLNFILSDGVSTGNIPLYCSYLGSFSTYWSGSFVANSYISLIYEGTNDRWVLIGCMDTNTVDSIISQSEITTGTSTSRRAVSAKILCDNFQKHTAIVTMPSGAIAPTAGYEPNTMYDFGKVSSVTFAAYDTSKEIANAVNLYMCTFQVASGGTTLRLNANIKYPNGDDGTELTNLLTEEDRVFEITIRDNKLSYLYFD